MKEVVLRLDEATARDLYETLYEVGEHWAAGAPIAYPPSEVHSRLAVVLKDLAHQLGLLTMAEAMERGHAAQAKLEENQDEPGDAGSSSDRGNAGGATAS